MNTLLIINEQNQKSLKTTYIIIVVITLLIAILAIMLFKLLKLNRRYLLLNEKLTVQGHELENLNEQKDRFFSFVAHNLKNPFNTIMGFAQLMQRFSDEKDIEKAKQYSGLIYNLSSQVQKVLSNLLEWSRLQRRNNDFKSEIIEIKSLVKDVLEMNTKEAAIKDIHIDMNIGEHQLALADRSMITTVIQNLVNNAIYFTPQSGRIEISSLEKDSFLEISIEDTGDGMSDEKIKQLFRFDSFNSPGSQSNEGSSGLGLIICKEMINKHGGDIYATSTPGKGSRFSFTLPAVKGKPEEKSSLTNEKDLDKILNELNSVENSSGAPELNSEIYTLLATEYSEVSKILSIENLNELVNTIITTAEAYNIDSMKQFGISLKQKVQSHQIDQIIKILPEFEQFLQKLNNNCEK